MRVNSFIHGLRIEFYSTVIAYVLGAYCDYYTSPIFAGALAAVYGVLFFFFPETPLYLLKQNEITVCIRNAFD